VSDTLIASYNDIHSVGTLFDRFAGQIAAVIVEPIAGNMGFIKPEPGFLQGLQDICHKNDSLFILDEVMTGFRVSMGGAQILFELNPDLTCLGKVIGGGLPVGAYAGKKEIMQHVAPSGEMYQAGTLSGNPLVMTAGLATLKLLLASTMFEEISVNTRKLTDGIREIAAESNIPMQIGQAGTMFGFFFLKEPGVKITNYESAKKYADTDKYAKFFHTMLANGIYFAPSQFEAGFLSGVHTESDIMATLEAIKESMAPLG